LTDDDFHVERVSPTTTVFVDDLAQRRPAIYRPIRVTG